MCDSEREKYNLKEITNRAYENKQDNDAVNIGSGYVITESVKRSLQQTSKQFSKPESYTGNRALYDSGKAKIDAKKKLFQDNQIVRDPYTGKELVLTKKEAKMLYGDKWADHLAESDHIKSLERIYDDTKSDIWNTTDDIKQAANSDDNLRVVSRKFNNVKRSDKTTKVVEDEEKLMRKGITITEEGKKQAKLDEELAEKSINQQLKKSAIKNIGKTFNESGKISAQNSALTAVTMSGIMNMVSLIKGEKSVEEAISDTAKVGGNAAVTGYVMGGGLTVVSHSLTNSSSKFIQGLIKSNVPGKVITAVMATGNTLKRWGEGELTTQECMIELGDKGLNMLTMGYSMTIGQTLIPIPIVGGAIGALVGSILTSSCYNDMINTLQRKELEHQERMRLISESRKVAEQAIEFKKELESYLNNSLRDYKDCFDMALSSMKFSYQIGDSYGIIASANEITRKLGGQVQFDTVEQFKDFLDDDSVDIF